MNRRTLLKATIASFMAGCGYTTRPMYPCSIQTVYVPIFKSRVFRRGLEFQLTEAVAKEIEQKTPYKIVHSEDADTILKGEIKSVRKRVLFQTPEDEPRELEAALAVEVEWRDNRSGSLLCEGQTPGVPFLVRADSLYAPELGQTAATAFQETVNKMAVQVVAMMEEPW